MPRPHRPQWQQATALITLGAGGAVTGFSFVPKAPADLTSPASLPPVKLLALEHTSGPAPGSDAMLRAAIVHVARHFMRLAESRSPAEMEAMIWQFASADGANHGPSCAAFASLTLELASHMAGLESWVTGGTSYPWPVHSWVDGRVDPNPASPEVVSVLQDAQNHGRWRPLGDGYAPQPGDWVLFDGHVEVVTKYLGGVLYTIGGDSVPNMSVNAHEYSGPLQAQGVAGFVDNGVGMSNAHPAQGGSATGHSRRGTGLPVRTARAAGPTSSADPWPSPGPTSATGPAASADPAAAAGHDSSRGAAATAGANSPGPELAPRSIAKPPTVLRWQYAAQSPALPAERPRTAAAGGHASNTVTPPPQHRAAHPATEPAPAHRQPASDTGGGPQGGLRPAEHTDRHRAALADVPATGLRPARAQRAGPGEAAIPGLLKRTHHRHPSGHTALPPYHRHDTPPASAPAPGTAAQQAFINEVANGAMATQRRYGVPASVTIAQAIDESGWGQSLLATNDHNLFGIKGTGPAGSDQQQTQEVINGQFVNLPASFQIYQNIAQSIDAHGRLLAHSSDYASAMANSRDPNAFAAALTGVYATDPAYGMKLIELMQHYDLYRFDRPAAHRQASGSAGNGAGQGAGGSSRPGRARPGPHPTHHAVPPAPRIAARRSGSHPHPGHSRLPQPGPGARHTGHGGPVPKDGGPVGNPVPVEPGPAGNQVLARQPQVGNPVPVLPVPVAGSRPPGHNPAPFRGTHTGLGATAPHEGTPRPGQAADRPGTAQHDSAVHPPAALYPGRSARPAPLAHPARPSDLARVPGAAPGPEPGAFAGAAQPARTANQADPIPGTGRSQPATGKAAAAGHPPPGKAAGHRLANKAADAAIPGVPPAAAPQAGHEHSRLPGGRIWPGHPAARSTAGVGSHPPAPAGHGTAGDTSGAAITPRGAHPATAPDHIPPASAVPAVAPAGPRPAPARPAPATTHRVPAAAHPVTAHPVPAAAPAPAAASPRPAATIAPAQGGTDVPGLGHGTPGIARTRPGGSAAGAATGTMAGPAPSVPPAGGAPGASGGSTSSGTASGGGGATLTVYHAHMPPKVREAFVTSAKMPLVRAEPLYRDVASHTGIRWEILAACDWMQCRARQRYSPVYGEKLGTLNPDETCYRTKSAALQQCASDLVQLARSVYRLDIATGRELTVQDLARVFAAFRWGGLLRQHNTSAMDFPYSVAGLTADHLHMRWPNIDDENAPDKPGGRFRQPFGAVPVVLGLNYQALM